MRWWCANQWQLSWDFYILSLGKKTMIQLKNTLLLLQSTITICRLTQAAAKKDWLSWTARSPGGKGESFLATWQTATEVTVHVFEAKLFSHRGLPCSAPLISAPSGCQVRRGEEEKSIFQVFPIYTPPLRNQFAWFTGRRRGAEKLHPPTNTTCNYV